MSKVLNIPNGDYYVYVQDGGTIRLDTGPEQGEVRISGNLVVEGNTTTVESEQMVIRDNIIVINDGETGPGVTLSEAGLLVNRGTEDDGYWVFDETAEWTNPSNAQLITGAWHARDVGGTIGIKVAAISVPDDQDLYLINQGAGVISVTGTNNYENQVTDDDDIPNKKYVDDEITASLANVFQARIEDGTVSKSYIEVFDQETHGNPSYVEFAIDGVVVSTLTPTQFDVAGLRFNGTSIQTVDSNEDLVLSAPGTGAIRIDDTMIINSVPGIDDPSTTPLPPTDGVAVYASSPGRGNTGLYFVTESVGADSSGNIYVSDELISRNRALILSMLF